MMWSNIFALAIIVMCVKCEDTKKDEPRFMIDQCQLKSIARTHDVDKMNLWHAYDGLYCDLFEPIKDRKLSLLEIGFGCGHHVQGRSCLMWKEYFTQMTYYAIDYPSEKHESCFKDFNKEHGNKVAKMWFGDQSNTTFLNEVTKDYKGEWDIIIDDGGHRISQITASFQHLWPHVREGGYYIVEDLAMDKGFAKIAALWAELLSAGDPKGSGRIKEGSDLTERLPLNAKVFGCSFQICYLRKVKKSLEVLPDVWGYKFD